MSPEDSKMSTDQGSPGNDDSAEQRKSAAASRPMGLRQAFREIRKGVVVMWWSFFDWLAVISWKALLLVAFLALILVGGVFHHPTPVVFFIIVSLIIKVVARGKRRAELTASEATRRAESEQLERAV